MFKYARALSDDNTCFKSMIFDSLSSSSPTRVHLRKPRFTVHEVTYRQSRRISNIESSTLISCHCGVEST
jgi:hypothetical protein